MDQFRELGITLWVISPDSREDLQKMGASMGLEFPLLGDPDLSIFFEGEINYLNFLSTLKLEKN